MPRLHGNPRHPGWGWIRDTPDQRDVMYGDLARLRLPHTLPRQVDLVAIARPIDDQGNIGSCVAQACSRAEEMLMIRVHGHAVDYSRLFIYWNARVAIGTQNEDSGCMIRDAVKSLAQYGACFEINWPYDVEKYAVEPEFGCFVQGEQFQIKSYLRLRNTRLAELLTCLADGFPFVFGSGIYESFMSAEVARTGIVPMPGWFDQMLGGHAMCAVGYDQDRELFKIANSWGEGWGDHGYAWMPFDYLTSDSLSDDFWTIRSMEIGNDA